ncbi:MAG: response regulator [Acidobacteria bacterium]|nr:response regulator [Acidobacteriota bacterium]
MARVLIVDDHMSDRELLFEYLDGAGFEVESCANGNAAWRELQAHERDYDVVLTDRLMPGMDGFELLERIKSNDRLASVPVILQSAVDDPKSMQEGIAKGAYYYVVKPYDREMLVSIVQTAANDHRRYRTLQEDVLRCTRAASLLKKGSFAFRTLSEAADLGTLIASTARDPENAVIGVTELLVNAVEHGTLGITYEEKTRLTERGEWEAEINRRASLPENADRFVRVDFEQTGEHLRITIEDDGPGFDWKRFLEVDPGRVFDTHGRGIAIANLLSFTDLRYEGRGNRVIGIIPAAESG